MQIYLLIFDFMVMFVFTVDAFMYFVNKGKTKGQRNAFQITTDIFRTK